MVRVAALPDGPRLFKNANLPVRVFEPMPPQDQIPSSNDSDFLILSSAQYFQTKIF